MSKAFEIVREYNDRYGTNYPGLLYSTHHNFFSGVLFSGRNFGAKNAFYGSFPPGVINRVKYLLEGKKVLLPYAGKGSSHLTESVFKPVTIDIDPATSPEYVCDVEDAPMLRKCLSRNRYRVIMADPPYSLEDSVHYAVSHLNKEVAIQNLSHYLAKDGVLIWMDECVVPPPKGFYLNGIILVYRSTNNRLRYLLFYSREPSYPISLCSQSKGYFYGVAVDKKVGESHLRCIPGRKKFLEAVYKDESLNRKGVLKAGCSETLLPFLTRPENLLGLDTVLHVGKFYPMFKKEMLSLTYTIGLTYYTRCRGLSGFKVV